MRGYLVKTLSGGQVVSNSLESVVSYVYQEGVVFDQIHLLDLPIIFIGRSLSLVLKSYIYTGLNLRSNISTTLLLRSTI